MVVVSCCRHQAHALAGSQFLCKPRVGTCATEKVGDEHSSLIFHPSTPCSIQDCGPLVCGVVGHSDLTRYFITPVEAHKKTTRGCGD